MTHTERRSRRRSSLVIDTEFLRSSSLSASQYPHCLLVRLETIASRASILREAGVGLPRSRPHTEVDPSSIVNFSRTIALLLSSFHHSRPQVMVGVGNELMEQAMRFEVQIQKVDPAATVGRYIKCANCASPRSTRQPRSPWHRRDFRISQNKGSGRNPHQCYAVHAPAAATKRNL